MFPTYLTGAPGDDVILQTVTATNNNMHGVLIENPRSFIKVRVLTIVNR